MNSRIHLNQFTVWCLVILFIMLPGCTGIGGSSSWVQSIKDLCLVVDQSYPGAPADFKQPIAEELQGILALALSE